MANTTTEDVLGQKPEFAWYDAIFVTEFVVICVTNAYTIIIFARNPNLCKRTTYLIINLTVADLLAGAVSGPLELFYMNRKADFEIGQFSWKQFGCVTFLSVFTIASLCSLSLISLERLHATVYPFSHCSLEKVVYFKAIIYIWLLAFVMSCVDAVLFVFMPVQFFYAWASHIVVALVIVTISYITIIAKVHRHPPPRPTGRGGDSDTKLSLTLFIMTVASVITTLPWALYATINPLHVWNRTSLNNEIAMSLLVHGLYYACSIVNPLIYAIRMADFRKAMFKGLCCKMSLADSNRNQTNRFDVA